MIVFNSFNVNLDRLKWENMQYNKSVRKSSVIKSVIIALIRESLASVFDLSQVSMSILHNPYGGYYFWTSTDHSTETTLILPPHWSKICKNVQKQ